MDASRLRVKHFSIVSGIKHLSSSPLPHKPHTVNSLDNAIHINILPILREFEEFSQKELFAFKIGAAGSAKCSVRVAAVCHLSLRKGWRYGGQRNGEGTGVLQGLHLQGC